MIPLLTNMSLQSKAHTNPEQKKQDQYSQLKNWIDSKQYRFHAISATTKYGRSIQPSGDYFLELNNNLLSMDLPYYGRSYSTVYPGTDVGIEFNTLEFTYIADTAKKGGWEITVLPKNESNASKISMSVTTSGYCTLSVSSNSRQPISYYRIIIANTKH
jgi:hypothetical protein